MKKSQLINIIREAIKEQQSTPHPAVSDFHWHQQLPSNFTTRMNNKGCSYVVGVKAKLEQKLASKQAQQINPRWQQLLQGKINYVDTLIQQLDSIMPAGNGWQCPPPPTGMNINSYHQMNSQCRTGMTSC